MVKLKLLECAGPAKNISLHVFAGSQQQVKGQVTIIYHLVLKSHTSSGLCAIDYSFLLPYLQPVPCSWLLSTNV